MALVWLSKIGKRRDFGFICDFTSQTWLIIFSTVLVKNEKMFRFPPGHCSRHFISIWLNSLFISLLKLLFLIVLDKFHMILVMRICPLITIFSILYTFLSFFYFFLYFSPHQPGDVTPNPWADMDSSVPDEDIDSDDPDLVYFKTIYF